jgi:hypothetical protein
VIRTVLGDVAPDELGRCDYHEHLFQLSPLLPGDELDDEAASAAEAGALRAAGIDAMVEATPTGLGRDPVGVARISAATGLRVVHVTGGHRSEHYGSGHWLPACSEAELAARFTADVRDALPAVDGRDRGAPATGPGGSVRAGLVKAGVGYWRIDPFERRVLAAAAATAAATGVAVMVHLEHGSAAHEVLAALAADGVPADRVGSPTPTATSTPACTPSSPAPAPTSAMTAWPATARRPTRRSWTAWSALPARAGPTGCCSEGTSPAAPATAPTAACPAWTTCPAASCPASRIGWARRYCTACW